MNKIIDGLREAVDVATNDRLGPGDTMTWQYYTIRLGERGMHWVTKNGSNPMPGACCFKTISDAKKGIAALIVTESILRGVAQHDDTAKGDLFWSLMELSR